MTHTRAGEFTYSIFERIDASCDRRTAQALSTTSSIPTDEEPEGLTYWDLDGRKVPGIEGQLHAILLDNDTWSDDDVYLKHYRVQGL